MASNWVRFSAAVLKTKDPLGSFCSKYFFCPRLFGSLFGDGSSVTVTFFRGLLC
jgi:hypothetical protein